MSRCYGIDVSKWQTTTPSLTGLGFLFARATIGTQRDGMYATHIANAKRAGLRAGAYHFGFNGVDAVAQAKAFIAAAGNVDFYVLDHEGANQMTDAEARRFVDYVQSTGRKCGVYASLSGFPHFTQDYNWLALWGSDPPSTFSWKFWQYGGSPIDRDVFNGDRKALDSFAGLDIPSVPVLEPTPVMRSFTIDPAATAGWLTVTEPGHYYLDLATNKEVGPIDPSKFGNHRAFGPITLTDGGISPTDPRNVGYLCGTKAAFLLSGDGVYTPDALGASPAEVVAAADAAHTSGVSEGTTSEQSRIRGVLGI